MAAQYDREKDNLARFRERGHLNLRLMDDEVDAINRLSDEEVDSILNLYEEMHENAAIREMPNLLQNLFRMSWF